MIAAGLCAGAGGLVGCGDNRAAGGRTPEEVVASATDGMVVTVEGTVHALTFDNVPGDDYPLLPDRFLLIRTVRAPGTSQGDLEYGNVGPAWGLGVRIPGATLATAALPQLGDRVRVTGRFAHVAWAATTMPVLEDARIDVLSTAVALGPLGAACSHDLDCRDRLVCDRARRTCASPAEDVTWGEDWRNLHGSCTTDADCPLPEVCDARYTTATTGPYAPPYFLGRDGGKHLCVAPDGATIADLCPRLVTSADVVGGRFVGGKEVCIDATVWLPALAPDGDTHLQIIVDEPLPYPAADVAYYLGGAPTEISPPYKDPARPQGAVLDPSMGDHLVLVGTVRYDEDHGWFEIHSVKTYATLARGPSAKEFRARYPSHPGTLDWEAIEHESDAPAEHGERRPHGERAHAREIEERRAAAGAVK